MSPQSWSISGRGGRRPRESAPAGLMITLSAAAATLPRSSAIPVTLPPLAITAVGGPPLVPDAAMATVTVSAVTALVLTMRGAAPAVVTRGATAGRARVFITSAGTLGVAIHAGCKGINLGVRKLPAPRGQPAPQPDQRPAPPVVQPEPQPAPTPVERGRRHDHHDPSGTKYLSNLAEQFKEKMTGSQPYNSLRNLCTSKAVPYIIIRTSHVAQITIECSRKGVADRKRCDMD